MSLYNDLIIGRASLSVIGLGYVGMPLAHAFSPKNIKVIGFDINVTKIATYKLEMIPQERLAMLQLIQQR